MVGLPGLKGRRFTTLLADPPWQFSHRRGKGDTAHRRLWQYPSLSLGSLCRMPVQAHVNPNAHLYLWVPNTLLPYGLAVMEHWGFVYKTYLVWRKVCRDGRTDPRGRGFYVRNATETLLFGVRGRLRTLAAGRCTSNVIDAPRGRHSCKPLKARDLIECCSPMPRLELFARESRLDWTVWGAAIDPAMTVPC